METGDWDGLHWVQGLSDEEIRTRLLAMLRHFRRVFILTLAEPSRVNVLQAMRIFEEREDVFYVTQDFLPWPRLDPEFERLVKPGLGVGGFCDYFGTFNGVVVFTHGSSGGIFSGTQVSFYWWYNNLRWWYDFHFFHPTRMFAWVPCENNADGNVFTIGEHDRQTMPTATEICW